MTSTRMPKLEPEKQEYPMLGAGMQALGGSSCFTAE